MLAIQAGLAVLIIGLGTIGLLFPSAVPSVPQAGSGMAIALLVVGAAGFALLALRAARTYTLTRRTTDLLVSVGCVWLAGPLSRSCCSATAPGPSTSATRWSCWASS